MSVLLVQSHSAIGRYKYTISGYVPPAITQIVETLRAEGAHARKRFVDLPHHIDIFAFLGSTGVLAQDALRTVTDSAGRRVELPQRISRVFAVGPPASILLYTLAPEKMVGWVRTPSPAEKAFLAESVRELLEYGHGRLTGRGGTANLENVLKFKPDLIIDIGSVGPTYVSLANNVQDQTKIPYVLLDGAFNKTPEMYRLLGVGMPSEVLQKIFDPFFTTKRQQGTGLGLSISQTLIARQGGRISVESEPGRGTTFAIWLPEAA